MKSDLRNLVIAEEAYFADSVKYTDNIIRFTLTPGVRGLVIHLTADGWNAWVGHVGTATVCAIFIGSTPLSPAVQEGEPRCEVPRPGVWQQSQSLQWVLSLREKTGAVGSYDAVFVVTGPDGSKYQTTVEVEGDDWGDALFPGDFGAASSKRGLYTWVCTVNGQAAGSGRFTW